MAIIDRLDRIPLFKGFKGGIGELVITGFSKLFSDALVLHDVLIEADEERTSQIDLILIDAKGIYAVEVKSFDEAKVYGNAKKQKWLYYRHGSRYEFYNPIMQNRSHIKYLKRLLAPFGEVPFYSLINLLGTEFEVSNINSEGVIDTGVCNSFPSMKDCMRQLTEGKPEVFDKEKQREIFNYIKENQRHGAAEKRAHKERAVQYRRSIEECEKQLICPFCKAPLVLRSGKYGEFYGCSNYPNCKYTKKKFEG